MIKIDFITVKIFLPAQPGGLQEFFQNTMVPSQKLQRNNISDTIFFGSARTISQEEAKKKPKNLSKKCLKKGCATL